MTEKTKKVGKKIMFDCREIMKLELVCVHVDVSAHIHVCPGGRIHQTGLYAHDK